MVPAEEELARVFRVAPVRDRVSIALMAFSGLRPQVMGDSSGSDGLRLKDIPDVEISGDKPGKQRVKFASEPLHVTVRFGLSKKRNPYNTFLCNQGAVYLRDYLEARIKEGELLSPSSPVLQYDRETVARKDHKALPTFMITRMMREAIRKSGFAWRPYIFRAYFSTGMDKAEGRGLISHAWRQHFMGHIGDIESTYSTGKALRTDTIEEMRKAYSRCSKFLETESKGMGENELDTRIADFKRTMLKLAGCTDGMIEGEKLLDLNDEDLLGRIDEMKTRSVNGGHSQKVISFKEVEEFIAKGWEFVTEILGRKTIVKLRSK